MRGICALLVVLFHIPIYHALKGTASFVNLQFCVDMFFALSGFVLCHAYGHRLNDGSEGLRFAWMRFARLWPLHMVMLGLFVAIEFAKLVFMRADGSLALDSQPFGSGHSPWELVTNILFLQSFNLHSGLSWNGPAWSAAVEFYVSLLFAGRDRAVPALPARDLPGPVPRRRLAAVRAFAGHAVRLVGLGHAARDLQLLRGLPRL